ncbi:hypothetical protein [Sphingobacterium sp. SYP-B4668]|uniref:hypothetical protein n=1 Tax=Sphingobacterium sp. SYP-B4668 TaxID=2996035 RepID=UPI000532376B|nr:hypothetical protein [Sphingobacterium sp. SYP-B4668]
MGLKLTPLNIVLACILVWFFSELGNPAGTMISIPWMIVLVVVLSVMDLLFRIWLKAMNRVWIFEIGFILMVSIVTILIKMY